MICLPERCHILHLLKAECEQHRSNNMARGDNGVQTDSFGVCDTPVAMAQCAVSQSAWPRAAAAAAAAEGLNVLFLSGLIHNVIGSNARNTKQGSLLSVSQYHGLTQNLIVFTLFCFPL